MPTLGTSEIAGYCCGVFHFYLVLFIGEAKGVVGQALVNERHVFVSSTEIGNVNESKDKRIKISNFANVFEILQDPSQIFYLPVTPLKDPFKGTLCP